QGISLPLQRAAIWWLGCLCENAPAFQRCGCSSVDRVLASEAYSHPGLLRKFEYWSKTALRL
ncbi:MAG: hypothetical protein PHF58_13830, partial [Methylotenera sp.]|nr:hypothetical protein [Methylotenera sp.]